MTVDCHTPPGKVTFLRSKKCYTDAKTNTGNESVSDNEYSIFII